MTTSKDPSNLEFCTYRVHQRWLLCEFFELMMSFKAELTSQQDK